MYVLLPGPDKYIITNILKQCWAHTHSGDSEY